MIAPRGVAVAAVALLAAACTSGGGPDIVSAPAGPACPDLSVLADRVEDLETSPSDESLEPITIGFVNDLVGTGAAAGFEAGINLVNGCLGGIDGHPVSVRTCAGGADAAGAEACATQMASDSAVPIVAVGHVPAIAVMTPILDAAGKSMAVSAPTGVAELASATSVALYPGAPGTIAGLVAFALDELEARRITAVVPNDGSGQPALDALGHAISGTRAALVAVGVGVADLDHTAALAAVPGAVDADLVVAVLPPSACAVLAGSLGSLRVDAPVASTPDCRIDGWYVGFDNALPVVGALRDEAALLRNALRRSGPADPAAPGTAEAFGTAIALWEVGTRLGFGESSPTAWGDALRAFAGPMLLGSRQLPCGVAPSLPALCGVDSWVLRVEGTTLVDDRDGEPVRPFAT